MGYGKGRGRGEGRGEGRGGMRDVKEETEPALPKPAPKGDQITACIGEVGRWQLEKILIVFIAAAPGLAHIFHAGFITPKQKFWCEEALNSAWVDGVNNAVDNGWDLTADERQIPDTANLTTLTNTGAWPVRYKYNKTEWNNVWVSPGDHATGYKVQGHCIPGCESYDFDKDFWQATMTSEFTLVCENTWKKTFAKMLLFSGFALGSFCSGLVSDRFGRKTAIWMCSVIMVVFGVITSLVPYYWIFVFTWWITGTMAIACYTAAFVWTMEICAGKWKIYLGMSMNYSWPVCRLIIAGLAWTFRDYHIHLQCISALVAVGSVILYWLPESPRWLVARGRMDEARAVLSQASKKNGKPLEPEQIILTKPNAAASQGGFLDIMRHPTLCLHTFIMYFNWFTTAFIMYGLALSWQELTDGLFLNFLIGTILDFPAKTLAMLMVQHVGRKYPYIVCQGITGIMFLLTLCFERGAYAGNWPIVVLALIGNFCTTCCFAILYMYTGELMPTTVRAAGVGSCSLVSKLGGTMSTTVAALADISPIIPTLIFVVMSLISTTITFVLPETKGRDMPATIADVERIPCKLPCCK